MSKTKLFRPRNLTGKCASCHFFNRGALAPLAGNCRRTAEKPLMFGFNSCPHFYARARSMARPGDLAAIPAGVEFEG